MATAAAPTIAQHAAKGPRRSKSNGLSASVNRVTAAPNADSAQAKVNTVYSVHRATAGARCDLPFRIIEDLASPGRDPSHGFLERERGGHPYSSRTRQTPIAKPERGHAMQGRTSATENQDELFPPNFCLDKFAHHTYD
jgi:hypothetical protein